MNTVLTHITGMNLAQVPLIVPEGHLPPFESVASCPDYCGAGEGIGNSLVPEKIWGIKISPACWSHDVMWDLAEASWRDFHHSNSVFHMNINTLLRVQSQNSFVYHLRLYRAVSYFNAVDTVGAAIFWAAKTK